MSAPLSERSSAHDFYKHYDEIFAHKKYAQEVAVVMPLLNGPKRILDVGCGTGEHARHFTKKGVTVVGFDTEYAAIEVAKAKKIKGASFLTDWPGVPLNGQFDAAVCLFNVVNYILTPEDLKSFFRNIHRLLRPDSMLVFDCWNGEAALLDPPVRMSRKAATVTPTLDKENRLVHMSLVAKCGAQTIVRHEYDHKLWQPYELADALVEAGFKSWQISPWMKPAQWKKKEDWKIMLIARKL